MTYDCMTPEELALWMQAARRLRMLGGGATLRPCTDCPLAFHLAEMAAGRCVVPAFPASPEGQKKRKREWMRVYRARNAA